MIIVIIYYLQICVYAISLEVVSSKKRLQNAVLKGILHPKMQILSSFSHPQLLQTCMSLFGSNRSSKYLPLCSAEERKSYWFATT